MTNLLMSESEVTTLDEVKNRFHHSPKFLRIWIPKRVVPKLRPRSNKKGRSYLPKNYRVWKNTNCVELVKLMLFNDYEFGLDRVSMSYWDEGFPIKDAQIVSNFCFGLVGDRDNCHGAILDLLVAAGIIEDDRAKIVPEGSYRTFQSKDIDGTLVLIKPGAKIMDMTLDLLLDLVP